MEGEGKHVYTIPRSLSRPVTILQVESKLFGMSMVIPAILVYTGQWLYGAAAAAVMYVLGRLMTSSDNQFMGVIIAAARLDKKVFLPELFDETRKDLAFELVADEE